MSLEKLEKMDEKLDTLITGQALLSQLVAQLAVKVDDHEEVLYGKGTEHPGMIARILEVSDTVSKVKKISLAAVTALVGGLVTLLFKSIHLPWGKGG